MTDYRFTDADWDRIVAFLTERFGRARTAQLVKIAGSGSTGVRVRVLIGYARAEKKLGVLETLDKALRALA